MSGQYGRRQARTTTAALVQKEGASREKLEKY